MPGDTIYSSGLLLDAKGRYGGFFQTWDGTLFYPFDPRPEEISIENIAHALARIARFTGHTEAPYYVAQHSLIVSQFCSPQNQAWGLMHDSAEAFVSDMSSPIKRMPEMRAYREMECNLMKIICKKFGLPPKEPKEVKEVDRRALVAEAQALLKPGFYDWGALAKPLPLKVEALSYSDAEALFLKRFHELFAKNTDGTYRVMEPSPAE